jgi:hypothetical protein
MVFGWRSAAVAAACGGALLASSASAEIQDFYIRNNGGNFIHYIYVSPSSSSGWEEDVLGSDVMDPYSELRINMIGYGYDECLFKVKIIDGNGYKREYYEVDLCEVLYIEFP